MSDIREYLTGRQELLQKNLDDTNKQWASLVESTSSQIEEILVEAGVYDQVKALESNRESSKTQLNAKAGMLRAALGEITQALAHLPEEEAEPDPEPPMNPM